MKSEEFVNKIKSDYKVAILPILKVKGIIYHTSIRQEAVRDNKVKLYHVDNYLIVTPYAITKDTRLELIKQIKDQSNIVDLAYIRYILLMNNLMPLECPVCEQPLNKVVKTLYCKNKCVPSINISNMKLNLKMKTLRMR